MAAGLCARRHDDRIDASQWEARDLNPTAQIISRKYYNSAAVGGGRNLTGAWRAVRIGK